MQTMHHPDYLYELLISTESDEAKCLRIESNPDYLSRLESDSGKELLLQMIAQNKSRAVQILIDFGVDVHKGSLLQNPLHVAVRARSADIVRCLLNAGADKNFLWFDPDVLGMITPLNLALFLEYSDIAEVLLAGTIPERGPLDEQDDSTTLLDYNQVVPVLRQKHTQQLRMRVSRHIDELAHAARVGDLSLVEKIVSAWNVNLESDGFTPLYLAAQHGHADVVALLLSKGADPEKLSQGSVPLIVASYLGYAQVVKLLISNGARIEASHSGRTSLYFAIEQGHIQVVKTLLEARANKEVLCNGKTPLFRAAELGSIELVILLLQAGARADNSCNGLTPEEIALQGGHNHVARMLTSYRIIDLVSKGKFDDLTALINPDIVNKVPHLLHIASANGNLEIVKLLLRARASVNKELRGATPLSIATYNRHAAVVKCLLQAGANPEIPYRGCTPLLIAELKEYHEIVKLLHAAQLTRRKKLHADLKTQIMKEARSLVSDSYHGRADRVSACAEPWNVNETVNDTSALYLASQEGHEEVVGLLLSKGADLEKVCAVNGKTPLFIACQKGHLGVVVILLRHGAKTETLC